MKLLDFSKPKLVVKQYNINVICKKCHRMNMLEVFKIASEEEITENVRCPTCQEVGSLIYASSIGTKHKFHI